MATAEQAEEAVKNLNNYNLMGSSISVEVKYLEIAYYFKAVGHILIWQYFIYFFATLRTCFTDIHNL